jgi:acetoin utilization protein AcuB
MRVSEKMIPNPLSLKLEQTAFTAKELMVLNDLECLFVVDDDGKPVGVVGTIAVSAESGRTKVSKIMSPAVVTLREDQPLAEAATIFAKRDYNWVNIPVVDGDGKLTGLVRMRELIGALAEVPEVVGAPAAGPMTPEVACIRLAMSAAGEEERAQLKAIREQDDRLAGVTQVGANAESLPLKMRESAVVAAIAHGVIKETSSEKVAVSTAIRDILTQMDMVSPGLGGGYKLGIVRGEGRVSVCAYGRCGHALSNSPEQLFLGTSTI